MATWQIRAWGQRRCLGKRPPKTAEVVQAAPSSAPSVPTPWATTESWIQKHQCNTQHVGHRCLRRRETMRSPPDLKLMEKPAPMVPKKQMLEEKTLQVREEGGRKLVASGSLSVTRSRPHSREACELGQRPTLQSPNEPQPDEARLRLESPKRSSKNQPIPPSHATRPTRTTAGFDGSWLLDGVHQGWLPRHPTWRKIFRRKAPQTSSPKPTA